MRPLQWAALGASLAAIALSAHTALAGPSVGDHVLTPSWCETREEMDELATIMAEEGKEGYAEYVMASDTNCIDITYYPPSPFFQPLAGVAAEMLYTIVVPEGFVFEIWRVEVEGNSDFYAWAQLSGQGA